MTGFEVFRPKLRSKQRRSDFFQEQYETSGAVLSRQIHFSKTEITLGVERMISLFPGWETASVLLQPMSQQYCSWEKRWATGVSQKKTTINCHWDGALFLQNSIPALLVQGSSRNILRKRWRNKDGAGKFNWCQEAAGEGPNSVARSTVFEMPMPVFS